MERYDLPSNPVASSEQAGVLRIASEADEKNCGCQDAAVTPNNLYSLLDYRKKSTAYTAGAVVACPYHKEFLLKCTTAGTTSANSINTKSVTKGSVITDGSAKWTVIASQIIDMSISGKVITVTFIDGTQKTLTTQDTNNVFVPNYAAGISVSSTSYTAPANGFFVAIENNSGTKIQIKVNNVALGEWKNYTDTQLIVAKGDVITLSTDIEAKFFPFKGV